MIQDILSGKYDDELEDLREAIRMREKQISQVNFFSFKVGDKVRFNSRCRPQYLIGKEAIIKDKKQKKVVVDIINPDPFSRFKNNVRTDVSLIEKV
jgi:hypothetical protein